ncbi:S-layer homology domain-containing protein [Leucobacter sp. HY1910]
MRRFQSAGRLALAGVATAALLLGGVGPAFAVTDEDAAAGIEETIEVPTELEVVTDEAPIDETSGDAVEGADSEGVEAPAAPEIGEGGVGGDGSNESDDDVVFTEFAGASEKPANPGVSTSATSGPGTDWSHPRRKISGKVTLPQGANASWLSKVNVGADCSFGQSGGGCAYDITYNKKTGAFSMMVPVARSGMTIHPGAFVADTDENSSINLVQQYWGQNCGVGAPKNVPAGNSHLTGVNLPMCLGATVSGTISDPQNVSISTFQYLYAYDGGTSKRSEGSGYTTNPNGSYTMRKLPRMKNLIVVLGGSTTASYQAWNSTYDLKQATPIDTTSGSVTGIDFTVKPGFADRCMMYDYCNKFYKEVMWMLETGISTGTKVDVGWSVWYNYQPKQNVTREAMAAFLYRMSDRTGYKAPKKQLFPDVKPNHKFYKQIQWMGATGISTGTKRNGKSYYEPSKSVTRDAMAAFLYRMSDRSGYVPPTKQAFPDVKPGHKFYTQIQWMSKAGISTGTKRNGKYYYDPSTAVSREAMAAFLYRFNN